MGGSALVITAPQKNDLTPRPVRSQEGSQRCDPHKTQAAASVPSLVHPIPESDGVVGMLAPPHTAGGLGVIIHDAQSQFPPV